MTSMSRRQVMTGAATVAGACGLAACGDEGRSARVTPSSPAGGGALASTSEVPVNGCLALPDNKVVLTQPEEGTFKAFSSVCTHQGCQVSSSTDGEIPCNCHGSRFSLEDGSVLEGPATAALASVAITVDGESILLS